MKKIVIHVELDYDRVRVSPSEVIFNVRRALDDYFNQVETEYDDDAIRVTEVNEFVV